MLSYNNKISVTQLQILLTLDIFGTGVLVLPRVVAEFSGQDGWLAVIIATALVMLSAFFITTLGGLFPGKTFFEYSSDILSKPIGTAVTLLFVIRIIAGCGMQLRFFGEIVRLSMLTATPFAVVCGIMLLTGAYAASKGYEVRARIGEILIFIVLLPIIFVFVTASTDIDFTNLMPVFAAKPVDLAASGFWAAFSFSGIELCLLVFPYVNRPESVRKGVVLAVAAIGVLMALITCVTIARFGPEEIQNQLWPVLKMMDTTAMPGSLMERQEALIMSFWIVSVFAVVSASLFFSSLMLRDVVKKGRRSIYVLLAAVIIFAVSFYPENLVRTFEINNFINTTLGVFYMFVLPPVMLITAKLRGLGKRA